MMLVTLEQASDHVRRDTTDDDVSFIGLIHAASGAVLNYMKGYPIWEIARDSNGEVLKDSDGAPIYETDSDGKRLVAYAVQMATLLLVAEFYKNRDGIQDGEIDPKFGYGYLPRPVVALLFPLRDPALV